MLRRELRSGRAGASPLYPALASILPCRPLSSRIPQNFSYSVAIISHRSGSEVIRSMRDESQASRTVLQQLGKAGNPASDPCRQPRQFSINMLTCLDQFWKSLSKKVKGQSRHLASKQPSGAFGTCPARKVSMDEPILSPNAMRNCLIINRKV